MILQPAVKWTGSKRTQAEKIVSFMEKEQYDTYYESFCGGCSVLYYILNACPEKFRRFRCSDINAPLVGIYNMIKKDCIFLADIYEKLWKNLNSYDEIEDRKKYFYDIRKEFNDSQKPELLFFIMRITTNGMPRYNSSGEFNNSFHVTRSGMNPARMRTILSEWNEKFNLYDVEFRACSYDEIKPEKNDLCYFDPPYFNTKGIYFGTIEYDKFYDYLRNLKCGYLFSFNGVSGNCNNIANVPKDVYERHEMILSGNSSFKRIIGKSNDSIVYESLYIKKQ